MAKLIPDDAFVARLGGDEFAVLLNAREACQDAGNIAAAIHRLFKETFNFEGRIVVVGASVGIALAPTIRQSTLWNWSGRQILPCTEPRIWAVGTHGPVSNHI